MRISDWSSDVCSSDLLPYGRPSPQVVQLAEVMQSYISLLVDQYQAGRTLQLIGLHGLGYGAVVGRCVDGYRKTQAVLVHEGFKRYRPHCGVMLEHRMQAYYSYLVGRKRGMYGLGLRYAMGNTAWAKHLKGVTNHDRASQGIQRYILLRVQPLASHPGGSLFVGDAGHRLFSLGMRFAIKAGTIR